jgi:hypothetical protein
MISSDPFVIGGNMKFDRSFALLLLLSVMVSASCGKESVSPSSSSAALTANATLTNPAARRFGRHMLTVAGLHSMSEFIRPDVRSRIDEEPVGDTDGGYDPSTLDPTVSMEEPQAESRVEQSEEPQPNVAPDEDTNPVVSSDAGKFLWAKKSFGDAVKADPTTDGVIVLYADENYYDLTRLMAFIEDGRSRIAKRSGIEGDRIQVVFGGYRGVPQVELWLVPEGAPMPEFRTDDRSKTTGPEN